MDQIRLFYSHLKHVARVMKSDEYAQYDDACEAFEAMADIIEQLKVSLALTKPQVAYLCSLYDILSRELYAAKGALDCVRDEVYNLVAQTEVCLR
jgi:flagellin-specific chaperone FliS